MWVLDYAIRITKDSDYRGSDNQGPIVYFYYYSTLSVVESKGEHTYDIRIHTQHHITTNIDLANYSVAQNFSSTKLADLAAHVQSIKVTSLIVWLIRCSTMLCICLISILVKGKVFMYPEN